MYLPKRFEEVFIGMEVEKGDGSRWLVVRIVKSLTLFEDEGKMFVVEESFVQLSGPDEGQVDFQVYDTKISDINLSSTIKPLSASLWRR